MFRAALIPASIPLTLQSVVNLKQFRPGLFLIVSRLADGGAC